MLIPAVRGALVEVDMVLFGEWTCEISWDDGSWEIWERLAQVDGVVLILLRLLATEASSLLGILSI